MLVLPLRRAHPVSLLCTNPSLLGRRRFRGGDQGLLDPPGEKRAATRLRWGKGQAHKAENRDAVARKQALAPRPFSCRRTPSSPRVGPLRSGLGAHSCRARTSQRAQRQAPVQTAAPPPRLPHGTRRVETSTTLSRASLCCIGLQPLVHRGAASAAQVAASAA